MKDKGLPMVGTRPDLGFASCVGWPALKAPVSPPGVQRVLAILEAGGLSV